jgi:quinohemoprotein ethanol dehydrogenase
LLPRADAPVPGGVFVWKLGGLAPMPARDSRPQRTPPADAGSEQAVTLGGQLYAHYCMQCHGAAAVAGGGMRDLRYSPYLDDAALFRRPPLEGLLAKRGMPDFSTSLQAEQVDAIRAYIIRMAHVLAKESGTD